MTLGGLLKHLAYVEDYRFTEVVGHERNRGAGPLKRREPAEPRSGVRRTMGNTATARNGRVPRTVRGTVT